MTLKNADAYLIDKIKNYFNEIKEDDLFDLMSAGNGYLDFNIQENTNSTLEMHFRGDYLGFAEFIERSNPKLSYCSFSRYIAEDSYDRAIASDNPLDLAEEFYGGLTGYYEAFALAYLTEERVKDAFPKEFNEDIDKHFSELA